MSNLSHLKALIKKNLLVYKGTLVLTLIELLFPILVIFLFWRLRALFKIVIVPHLPDLTASPGVDGIREFTPKLADIPGDGKHVIQIDDYPP